MGTIGILLLSVASFANAILPGPCVLLTISRASHAGLRSAVLISWGVAAANLALASVALSATMGILLVSQEALGVLRWFGLAVLVVLGVKLLRSNSASERSTATNRPAWRDLFSGFAVGVSSPYNLVFLLALLPQFVPTSGLTAEHAFSIVAAVVTGALLAQLCASGIGLIAARLVSGVASGRVLERAGGGFLVGFAALFAFSPI